MELNGSQMHEYFLEGWTLQKEGKIMEAMDCYRKGIVMGDKCALFQYHCMDRIPTGKWTRDSDKS